MQRTVLLSEFCPSVRCVYCDKTKWHTADILIPHETAITLVFLYQHWLVSDAPFHLRNTEWLNSRTSACTRDRWLHQTDTTGVTALRAPPRFWERGIGDDKPLTFWPKIAWLRRLCVSTVNFLWLSVFIYS